jgi:hypothetical protein
VTKLAAIIDAATDADISVPSLLRKLKVVAARLDTPPLLGWVDNELSGYPGETEIPGFRGPFRTQVLTNWTGPFGSYVNNLPLPSMALPEWMRGSGGFELAFRQSISELEELSKLDDQISAPWDADAVAMVNILVDKGEVQGPPMHGMVSARRVTSSAVVKSILDNVCTRVLGVALDLEKIVPSAGEPGQPPVADPQAVNMVVNNHIYGDGNAVAVGPGASQLLGTVQKGDRDSLRRALEAAGLPVDLIAELDDAIDTDGPEQPGSRVAAVLGRIALGVGSGANQMLTGAAGGVIAQLVNTYYGLA